MAIPIRTSKADTVRRLKNDQPSLTAQDITGLTGFRLAEVKAALTRLPKDKPKSRAGG